MRRKGDSILHSRRGASWMVGSVPALGAALRILFLRGPFSGKRRGCKRVNEIPVNQSFSMRRLRLISYSLQALLLPHPTEPPPYPHERGPVPTELALKNFQLHTRTSRACRRIIPSSSHSREPFCPWRRDRDAGGLKRGKEVKVLLHTVSHRDYKLYAAPAAGVSYQDIWSLRYLNLSAHCTDLYESEMILRYRKGYEPLGGRQTPVGWLNFQSRISELFLFRSRETPCSPTSEKKLGPARLILEHEIRPNGLLFSRRGAMSAAVPLTYLFSKVVSYSNVEVIRYQLSNNS